MDKKTITAVSVTAVIGLLIAGIWSTFFKGVEAIQGENPAIVANSSAIEVNTKVIQENTLSNVKLTSEVERNSELLDKVLTAMLGDR